VAADGALRLEVQERAHHVGRVRLARAREQLPAGGLDTERRPAGSALAKARPGVADGDDPRLLGESGGERVVVAGDRGRQLADRSLDRRGQGRARQRVVLEPDEVVACDHVRAAQQGLGRRDEADVVQAADFGAAPAGGRVQRELLGHGRGPAPDRPAVALAAATAVDLVGE
jgi:hypothetical protein